MTINAEEQVEDKVEVYNLDEGITTIDREVAKGFYENKIKHLREIIMEMTTELNKLRKELNFFSNKRDLL